MLDEDDSYESYLFQRDHSDTYDSYRRHKAYDRNVDTWLREGEPPRPEFIDTLHDYLMAAGTFEATQEAPSKAWQEATSPSPLPASIQTRQSRWRDVSFRRKVFWRTFAVAAVLALMFGTARWLPVIPPTSPFYVFHSWLISAETTIARGNSEKALVQVSQAQTALDQLEMTVEQGNTTGPGYAAYLNSLLASVNQADVYVRRVPDGVDRFAFNTSMGQVRADATTTLKQALPQQQWDDRLQTTNALAALGVNVPTIRGITYHRSGNSHGNSTATGGGSTTKNPGKGNHNHGTKSSGVSGGSIPANSLVVQIHGTGFLPGALFFVNGHAVGQVTSITANEVDVVLNPSASNSLKVGTVVGIGNADGTATVYTLTVPTLPPSPAAQTNMQTIPTSSATVPRGTPPLH